MKEVTPRRRWKIWLGLAIGIGLVVAGVSLYRAVLEVPKNAYAMWAAGELVAQHLRLNDKKWPTGWAQLDVTFRAVEGEGKHVKEETRTTEKEQITTFDVFIPASFEDITNRVSIDWSVDVAKLKQASFTNGVRPFRVITLKNGEGTHYQGREPNAMVWQYLQAPSISK